MLLFELIISRNPQIKTLPFLCLNCFEEITLEFTRLAENFLIELFFTKTSTGKVVSCSMVKNTRCSEKVFCVDENNKSESDCIHVVFDKAGLHVVS